jgi:hypothetical protein
MNAPRRLGLAFSTLLVCTFAAATEGNWQSLFDGRDLTGWRQIDGTAPFTVENGVIVGTTKVDSGNSFLATEAIYGDFILELEVKQEGGPSNSGIQFRSESRPDYKNGRVHGYQLEIDPSARAWTGGIYDESRRGWIYPVPTNTLASQAYRFGEWNRLRIEAIGPSLRTWVNGVPVAHVVDALTPRGFIALQVHSIGSAAAAAGRRTLWRSLRIQTTGLQPSPGDQVSIRNFIPNDLSAAEQAQGWHLLWDGRTTTGWRGARKERFPETGWKIEQGELIVLESGGGESKKGGDIVTEREYSAFELQLDFKFTPGANSGIKYFVREEVTPIGGSAIGLEYQILDDARHPDAKLGAHGNRTLGSLYDLIAPGPIVNRPGIRPTTGEWHTARIVVRPDNRVEHWLNGLKLVDYVRGSPDFLARVAASKYRDIAGFGLAPAGRILLQDHGNEVHFRSIKIRPLN